LFSFSLLQRVRAALTNLDLSVMSLALGHFVHAAGLAQQLDFQIEG